MFNLFGIPWLQKAAQLNLDEHQQIMDNTLLWLWLRPKLANAMDGSTMEKLDEMWLTGLLGQFDPQSNEPLKTRQDSKTHAPVESVTGFPETPSQFGGS